MQTNPYDRLINGCLGVGVDSIVRVELYRGMNKVLTAMDVHYLDGGDDFLDIYVCEVYCISVILQ